MQSKYITWNKLRHRLSDKLQHKLRRQLDNQTSLDADEELDDHLWEMLRPQLWFELGELQLNVCRSDVNDRSKNPS